MLNLLEASKQTLRELDELQVLSLLVISVHTPRFSFVGIASPPDHNSYRTLQLSQSLFVVLISSDVGAKSI